jgi:hypothetical protein
MKIENNTSPYLAAITGDTVTLHGREFKINSGFSSDRFIEMMTERTRKTPVVFLSNLHTNPTPEFGFLVSKNDTYWFVAFIDNLLHFCDEGFDNPVWQCVTAKCCSPQQCFVIDDWDSINPMLEKPYLVDRKPVTDSELIAKAKELGYSSNNGVFRTSYAAMTLREAGSNVTENNYLTFKHKLL